MILNVLRIIFGSIFILFLPGYAWSFVFFKKKEVDLMERIALSFGLSISLVPLTVFYLNYLLKVKINHPNVSLAVATLTAIPLAFVGVKSLETSLLKIESEHLAYKQKNPTDARSDGKEIFADDAGFCSKKEACVR